MQPILVTGSPRSGTTWIGKMIDLSPKIGYIHEPYNFIIKNNLPGDPIPFNFAIVQIGSSEEFVDEYNKIISFNTSFSDFFSKKKTVYNFLNSIIYSFRFRKYRSEHRRPLIKDPFTILSTEWLVNRFNIKPIVIIRHPGPIYDSISHLNWDIDFHEIYQMASDSPMIRQIIDDSGILEESQISLAEKVGLLWTIIHKTIANYQKNHPNWLIIRYEDIFTNLEHYFRRIFDYCDLQLDDEMLSKIYHYTSSGYFPNQKNPSKIKIERYDLLNGWKNRLEPGIKENLQKYIASDIYALYYNSEAWEIDGSY